MILARVAARRSALGPRDVLCEGRWGGLGDAAWSALSFAALAMASAWRGRAPTPSLMKVAAADQPPGDARAHLRRWRRCRRGGFVLAHLGELRREVGEALGDHMDHIARLL